MYAVEFSPSLPLPEDEEQDGKPVLGPNNVPVDTIAVLGTGGQPCENCVQQQANGVSPSQVILDNAVPDENINLWGLELKWRRPTKVYLTEKLH